MVLTYAIAGTYRQAVKRLSAYVSRSTKTDTRNRSDKRGILNGPILCFRFFSLKCIPNFHLTQFKRAGNAAVYFSLNQLREIFDAV
jgi:hypothetical protein